MKNSYNSPALGVLYSIFLSFIPIGRVTGQSTFIRGDVDGDGQVTLADSVLLMHRLIGREDLPCPDAADLNDNGVVNPGDFVYLLEVLLGGDFSTHSPFPNPGVDPSADGLGCSEMLPEILEEGGTYSLAAVPQGKNVLLRLSLQNAVPVVGGLMTFSLPETSAWDSKVLEVKPALELSTLMAKDYMLVAKVRADKKLTILWLTDISPPHPVLAPSATRRLLDVVLCPGTSSVGNYTLTPVGSGELIEESGKRRTAQVSGTDLEIKDPGSTCPDTMPDRLTVRGQMWMPDVVARVGETFKVPFFSTANVEHRAIVFWFTCDFDRIRIVGLDQTRPETTFTGVFANDDGFSFGGRSRDRHLLTPFYELLYCGPCNRPAFNDFYGQIGLRNYHRGAEPRRNFPPWTEFRQFEASFQVLPTAQGGETWIALADMKRIENIQVLGERGNNAFSLAFAASSDGDVPVLPRPYWKSRVTILPPGPPQTAFIRGDVNLDGGLNLTDVVLFLSVLFQGSNYVLRCSDAADTTDDGALDITDAVFTLAWLFLGGSPPFSPFLFPGTDPTEDQLPCGA